MRGAACIAIAVLAGATGYVRAAAAACAANDITGINYTSTSLAPYNPFTPFAPKVVSVTVSALRACGLELAFLSTSSPPRMIGFGSLNYDIQLASSAVSLVYTGGMPVTTAHIDIGPGNIGSTNVQINLPAGLVVSELRHRHALVSGKCAEDVAILGMQRLRHGHGRPSLDTRGHHGGLKRSHSDIALPDRNLCERGGILHVGRAPGTGSAHRKWDRQRGRALPHRPERDAGLHGRRQRERLERADSAARPVNQHAVSRTHLPMVAQYAHSIA